MGPVRARSKNLPLTIQAEIEKQIPRIVSLLGTSESSRDLVRTAFAAALQKLTPADLLVSLHDEAESGRKATIEGEWGASIPIAS